VGRIPEETIEAIRNRTDIVDLVGRYVSLRQTGRSFKGLCPFHQEKTPSFTVHPERQIFHCFGCGAGGNGFVFLMKHENLTFPEAARSLASLCGVEIPETESEPGEAGLLRRLREATAAAQSHYRTTLVSAAGQVARDYLAARGIDLPTAQRFGLGYAPDSWDALVRALGAAQIPAELGERAGLLAERKSGGHYDRLRGRVTFPIQDVRGDVVAFGGRVLPGAAPKPDGDEGPKYLNTPESPLFRKREAFYGLPEALEAIRRSERAIIVEGYFDRIALARAGMPESLATCGTALTPEHARQLRRRTREVVLLFDGDEAGQRAVERSLAILLPEGVRVRAAVLPPKDDPDSVLARDGEAALRAVVDAAVPAVEAVIRRVSTRAHATPWEKSDAVAAVAPLLALVADPVERGEHERQLALAVGVRPEDVKALVRREQGQRSGAAHVRDDTPLPDAQSLAAVEPAGPEQRWLRDAARLLIQSAALARGADAAALVELLPDSRWRRLLAALVEMADADGAIDVDALAERLDAPAAEQLRALAVEDRDPIEPGLAESALRDIERSLRKRVRREQGRELRQRIATGDAKLQDYVPLHEQRRAEQGLSSIPPNTIPAEPAT
jgi:DNA primase